jgi:hypothetical protein
MAIEAATKTANDRELSAEVRAARGAPIDAYGIRCEASSALRLLRRMRHRIEGLFDLIIELEEDQDQDRTQMQFELCRDLNQLFGYIEAIEDEARPFAIEPSPAKPSEARS